MSSLGTYAMLVGLLLFGCNREKQPIARQAQATKAPTDWLAAHTGASKRFTVRLEQREAQNLLTFMHGEDAPRPLRIFSLTVVRQDHPEDYCEIEAVDKAAHVLIGTYVLGTRPPNYTAKGCKKSVLGPGDYDLMVETDRGPVWRRMYIKLDRSVEFRFWEDYSGLSR